MWCFDHGCLFVVFVFFFFFKQKTAYEMRISDWSSDVCSSDLMTRENVTDYRLGMTHYGHAGIAEARGCVESRFKRVEDELVRYIAGGFMPEKDKNARIVVSTLKGARYPIIVDALEHLI